MDLGKYFSLCIYYSCVVLLYIQLLYSLHNKRVVCTDIVLYFLCIYFIKFEKNFSLKKFIEAFTLLQQPFFLYTERIFALIFFSYCIRQLHVYNTVCLYNSIFNRTYEKFIYGVIKESNQFDLEFFIEHCIIINSC